MAGIQNLRKLRRLNLVSNKSLRCIVENYIITNQPTQPNPPTNPTNPTQPTQPALRRAHQLPSRLPTASKVGKFTWRTRKGEVPEGLAGGWQPIGVYTKQLKTYLVGRTDIPEIFKTKYDHEIVWPIIMWLGSFASGKYICLNITYFFDHVYWSFYALVPIMPFDMHDL